MVDSRQKKITRNIIWGTISKIASMIISFVSRTVFIMFLGKSYLGVSGLYTDLLGVLSFAELGFGSAFSFAMYKPAAENNREKIIQLLNYYRKVYYIIAIVIACLGLAIFPFLQLIVKGAEGLSIFELRLYFLLYLINSVSSYYVSYKFNYLNAKMENHIITNLEMISSLIVTCLQIFAIIVFKNFLIYLITQVLGNIISKYIISCYLNKKEEIFRESSQKELSVDEKRSIYNDVRGLAVNQFSSVAIYSTDSIVTSMFTTMGILAVANVSNYNMIINSVLGFVVIVFNSLTSGFGNLMATSTKRKFLEIFEIADFIDFWIYGFSAIAFFVLIPPFISLWIGNDYYIDYASFSLIVINSYFQGQTTVFANARFAYGHFIKDRWVSFGMAIINLTVSIICARQYGLLGVYIGTIVSRMFLLLVRPLIMYKDVFDVSVSRYYYNTLKYFLSVFMCGIVTFYLTRGLLTDVTFLKFIYATFLVAIIPNLIFYLLYRNNNCFQQTIERVKLLLK